MSALHLGVPSMRIFTSPLFFLLASLKSAPLTPGHFPLPCVTKKPLPNQHPKGESSKTLPVPGDPVD